jgi:hypothetical protein
LHVKAINVVCNLLASHDLDPRYRSADAKARIATLYLPLINIVIDCLPQLYDPATEAQSAQQQVLSGAASRDDASRGIDQTVAMAIAGSSVYGVPGESASTVLEVSVFENAILHFANFSVFKTGNGHFLQPSLYSLDMGCKTAYSVTEKTIVIFCSNLLAG